MIRSSAILFAALAIFGTAPAASVAMAQGVPPAAPEGAIPLPPDSATGVSPGGAFLRSILIPGWGHLVTGSPTRGGFYFASAAFNGYMLFKTQVRVTTGRNAEQVKRREVEAELRRAGTDPDSIPDLVDADPRVQERVGLVEAREQQMEDWIAWTAFMFLLGGADAYVSAHLAGFPEPIAIDARPVGFDGRVEIGVSVGVGGPGG